MSEHEVLRGISFGSGKKKTRLEPGEILDSTLARPADIKWFQMKKAIGSALKRKKTAKGGD